MLGQALAACITSCGLRGRELADCIHMMINGF
jgi:hypothetical protein